MPRYIAFHNGKFIEESDLRISPMDRGFLYGDGLFETLRAVDRSVISFTDHWERLTLGCERVRIPPPQTMAEVRHAIAELLVRNNLRDAVIRLALTRGATDQFGYGFSDKLVPTIVIMVRPVKKIPEDLYTKGVAVAVMEKAQAVSAFKTTSAQSYALAKQAALDKGCYESILVGTQGEILEGTSSNVFLWYQGAAYTPALQLGILPGITRQRVIHLLKTKLHAPVEETTLDRKTLSSADEIFLTNTNVQILPVTRVENQVISNGRIGPMTQTLLNVFRQSMVEILE